MNTKVYLELKTENLLLNTARPLEKNLIGVSSASLARSKSRKNSSIIVIYRIFVLLINILEEYILDILNVLTI